MPTDNIQLIAKFLAEGGKITECEAQPTPSSTWSRDYAREAGNYRLGNVEHPGMTRMKRHASKGS